MSIMLAEICHLECVIRSPVLSQSVSVQCSVRKKIGGEGGRGGGGGRVGGGRGQLPKMWSEFQEAALVTT